MIFWQALVDLLADSLPPGGVLLEAAGCWVAATGSCWSLPWLCNWGQPCRRTACRQVGFAWNARKLCLKALGSHGYAVELTTTSKKIGHSPGCPVAGEGAAVRSCR